MHHRDLPMERREPDKSITFKYTVALHGERKIQIWGPLFLTSMLHDTFGREVRSVFFEVPGSLSAPVDLGRGALPGSHSLLRR